DSILAHGPSATPPLCSTASTISLAIRYSSSTTRIRRRVGSFKSIGMSFLVIGSVRPSHAVAQRNFHDAAQPVAAKFETRPAADFERQGLLDQAAAEPGNVGLLWQRNAGL